MKHFYLTNSFSETKKMGEKFAKKILQTFLQEKAVVLGLEGDLGGGKTTFLQGFAKGLGIKEKILSPTFVLMRRFQIPEKTVCCFYHFDCYRIQKPNEILDLGFREIISEPKNIVAIEWAERIKKILPKDTIILKFDFLDKNKRKITIKERFLF